MENLTKKHRISFCITCMNRLFQLKETLIKNINDNADYDDLTFIVLDYNSADGMESWVRNNLMDHINKGRVYYYKTIEPVFFNHSHAKNLAFNLSNADIVCNINADHYIGKGFANFVNDTYNHDKDVVITHIPPEFEYKNDNNPPGELWGKVCVKKADFLTIGGYDERMIKFGNDDIDFVNRLKLVGINSFPIGNKQFWDFIAHDDETRHSTKNIVNKVQGLYINQITPESTDLIFLFQDQHFEMINLIDCTIKNASMTEYAFNKRYCNYEYSIKDNNWLTGPFIESTESISFYPVDKETFQLYKVMQNGISVLTQGDDLNKYFLFDDNEIVEKISTVNYVYYNLNIMLKNAAEKTKKVNKKGFGKARVFKNFNYNEALTIGEA